MSRFYHDLFNCFERKILISLPERSDRRRRLAKRFAEQGLNFSQMGIEVFDGYRFDEAEGFPSKGVRGCFTSHREVIRRAANENCRVLIMEDDLQIFHPPDSGSAELTRFICNGEWDVLYFGYLMPNISNKKFTIIENSREPTIGGHFYGLSAKFASKIVKFMDDCERRSPGHPDGGPMYRDAAFNFFLDRNPDCNRALVVPSLGGQFSSRTDLGKSRFFDKIPVIAQAANLLREFKDRH